MAGIEIESNEFGSIRQRLGPALDQLIEDTTNAIVADIRQAPQLPSGCPVSVQRKGSENYIKVGDRRRFYIGFIEYGTRDQPAQPFVTPAAESKRSGFERDASELERELE